MRKLARHIAFLLLYACDMGETECETILETRLEEETLRDWIEAAEVGVAYPDIPGMELYDQLTPEDFEYIRCHVAGTWQGRESIDRLLEGQSKKWPTERMLSADRNILRLSVYEMAKVEDPVNRPIFINEAVELAKLYGDEQSYKFVNAILDGLAKRGNWDVH